MILIIEQLFLEPTKSEKDEVLQLANEIMRQRSSNKPDLVPRYVVPPRPHADPRPRVGPLSSNYEVADDAAYVTINSPNGGDDNAYVDMNSANAPESFYHDLEEIKTDPTV